VSSMIFFFSLLEIDNFKAHLMHEIKNPKEIFSNILRLTRLIVKCKCSPYFWYFLAFEKIQWDVQSKQSAILVELFTVLGPLHLSPVTRLARLPGQILLSVHMGNFSLVYRDKIQETQPKW